MNWVATCNYCGAPLVAGACPRCSYRRAEQSEPRKGQVVFTAADGGSPKVAEVRFITSARVTSPTSQDVISSVSLAAGESLMLFIFTNSTSLLGLPHIVGVPPTWNGIDSGPAGSWMNPADQTTDVFSVYYWNQPGAGTGSIVVNYDPLDDATTRIYFVVATNTNDTRLSGAFDFPPNGPGMYMSAGTGTATNTHTAQTDFTANLVFASCQLRQAQSATAGTWQSGFVRLHREGTTLGTADDLTGDIAYKTENTVQTSIGTQLSGFTSCQWGMFSCETRIG